MFQVPDAPVAQFQEDSFLNMVETIEKPLSNKIYLYRDLHQNFGVHRSACS